jgi:hypothetical protein
VAFGITQLLAPGFGKSWFGDEFRPAGWVVDQGVSYYLTQLSVLLVIVLIAGVFWLFGRQNLAANSGKSEESESEVAEQSPTSNN